MRNPRRERILKNYAPPEAIALVRMIGGKPEHQVSSWVSMDKKLEDLIDLLFDEMENTIEIKASDREAYTLFYVDTIDGNRLKTVNNQQTYTVLRNSGRAVLTMIH